MMVFDPQVSTGLDSHPEALCEDKLDALVQVTSTSWSDYVTISTFRQGQAWLRKWGEYRKAQNTVK